MKCVDISTADVFQALTHSGEASFRVQKRRNVAALIRYLGGPPYRISRACGISWSLVKKVGDLGPDYPDGRTSYQRRQRRRQLELTPRPERAVLTDAELGLEGFANALIKRNGANRDIDFEVKKLAAAGRQVEAARVYRNIHGGSLYDAHVVVEALMKNAN